MIATIESPPDTITCPDCNEACDFARLLPASRFPQIRAMGIREAQYSCERCDQLWELNVQVEPDTSGDEFEM